MIKRLFLVSMLFVLPAWLVAQAAAPAAAPASATTPNFSGTWSLNLQKSDFGEVPPPDSRTDVITQSGADFKLAISSTGGTVPENYTILATIGGAPTPTPAGAFPADADFQIASSQAQWQDSTLVLDSKISYQGAPGTLHSVYTLSPDGATLTCQSHISLDLGDFDITYVFDKK